MKALCRAISVSLIGGVLLAIVLPLRGEVGPDQSLESARTMIRDGHYAEAEALARKLLPETERRYGSSALETAEVLEVQVEAMWRGGKDDAPEARALAERSLAIKEKLLRPEDPGVVPSVRNMAFVLAAFGENDSARALFERVVAIQEKALGPEHPEVARSLTHLANFYLNAGRYAEAQPLFERTLAIQKKTLGPDSPAVALTTNNMAILSQERGDYARAKSLYERALAVWEKTLGPGHPDVASTLNGLAGVYKSWETSIEPGCCTSDRWPSARKP